MPAFSTKASCNATAADGSKQLRTMAGHITELPQPLLELILISGNSAKDKKALRQICKLFQETLDNNIVCLKLDVCNEDGRHSAVRLLGRMQNAHNLREVILIAPECCDMDSLLRSLPVHLRSVTLVGDNINLGPLGRLTELTFLDVHDVDEFTGMECVSGLTRLNCYSPVGSLKHLAPTLKHLKLRDYQDVQGMPQLTNLKVLEVSFSIPRGFFQKHRQLLLQHMIICPGRCKWLFKSAQAWTSAPATLTRLTLNDTSAIDILPGVLPTTVTHLQLLYCDHKKVEQAAAALPWLRNLDVEGTVEPHEVGTWNSALGNLVKVTNLQSLGICAHSRYKPLNAEWYVYMSRLEVMLKLPEVAKAVERGVKLDVIVGWDKMCCVFEYPCVDETVWATHG